MRELTERAGLDLVEVTAGGALADLTLGLRAGIGTQGFEISGLLGGGISIVGNEELGLLYGIGKFLHDGRYEPGRFTPGSWRGVSVPEKNVRGIYFALHQNWYCTAPAAEVKRYIEDLALWGMNCVVMHLQQPEDTPTPHGQANFLRNHGLLKAARELGLKIGLLEAPNVVSVDAPAELLAPGFPDTDPARRGVGPNRICPSLPAGFAYLSRKLEAYLNGFSDIGLDFVVAFPYDAGGCGCEQCWPWGARGYVTICKEFSRLARAKYPGCEFVLGTWCFDVLEEPDGEYEGLERVLAEDASWVDCIMADSHEDFPAYPLQPGSLAGLPIVNFAEISMWGRFPWGGSGANPLPERFQRLWEQSGHRVDGGFPYSEGNFEDINKVIYLRFFWDGQARAGESVREYVRYEFGESVEAKMVEAISLLERNLPRWSSELGDVEEAHRLILEADRELVPGTRAKWRWQILFWRAVVDFELATHGNEVSERCNEAYETLVEVLHLQNGWSCVTPPARSYLARNAHVKPELPPGAEPERDAAVRVY